MLDTSELEALPLSMPPGVAGIDAGITLTKTVVATSHGLRAASQLTASDTNGLPLDETSSLGITGARVNALPGTAGAVVMQEIEAAACGASALLAAAGRLGDGTFVLALLGTGTAFASVEHGAAQHLGGTPLGGGSFTAIARLVSPSLSYRELIACAARGDRRHADLMIADVYPDGIGRIGPDLTAAHLSKTGAASDDLLASVLNLHAENIGQIAASRSLIAGKRRLVLAGGFAQSNPAFVASLSEMTARFCVPAEIVPAGAFVGAVGAALLAARAEAPA